MKITLQMLLMKLKQAYPKIRIAKIKNDTDRHIEGIKLYSPQIRNFSESHLYIGKSEDLVNDGQELPPLFLCCCKKGFRNNKNQALLSIITVLDEAEILNALQEIYTHFQNWDRQMHELLIRDASVSQLVECTGSIMDNPILIYDLSLKMLAHSEINAENDSLIKEAVSQGYLPLSVMLEFEHLGVFLNEKLTSPLTLTPSSHASDTSAVLYQPFYHASSPCGYCVMLMSHLEPDEYERTMFENFYEYASISIDRLMNQQTAEGFMYEYALKDILDNQKLPEATVRERISSINLPFESEFILISLNSDQVGSSTRSYLLNQLHIRISNGITFEYKGKLLVLIFDNDRLDMLSYRRQIPELYTEILSAMETYHLTACCSMPFYKITDLSEAWHMNEEAFALYALLQPEERRLFFFEEHITQIMNLHVLERTSGHPCIPACIRAMLDNDREHNTRNALIVRTFLEENCRVTETAQRLHMHRNNIVYHIQRIQDQYQIDFSNQLERLNLQMTFQLMDLMRHQKKQTDQ